MGASGRMRHTDIRYKGSFLIEAMVELPLFICFMVFLMFYFRVMEVQCSVGEALSYTARFVAASAYKDTSGSDCDLMDLGAATILFREKLYEYGCREEFIALGANGISLMNSDLSGNDVELTAIYDMNVPVRVFGMRYFRICQSAVSRKWIGDKDFSEEGSADEWVYVTPTGSAYHKSTQCPYLDLSIHSIRTFDLLDQRNASGHIYYPCEVCKKSGFSDIVYITDYGEVYHSSLTCSGLKRTIFMVRISETGGRHACSKCY